ncbi:hypothetical protein [Magnetospira sp. QH-2]|uniref:hypothetical protein n=1 Tax=Magnetospira sp. (strain QH-2) TaxID=1288970 RepID=UPI0003E81078|nr:hypothetical protein [Magnetospira sp. QH-2]CCQ75445.1 exported protein of unknown function [Magnetospira sp. QH-2]
MRLLALLVMLLSFPALAQDKSKIELTLDTAPMNCLAAVIVAQDIYNEEADFLFRAERGKKLENKILYMIGSGFENLYLEDGAGGLAHNMKTFMIGVSRFDGMLEAMKKTPLAGNPRQMEHFLADCQLAIDDALAAEIRQLRAFRSGAIRSLTGQSHKPAK